MNKDINAIGIVRQMVADGQISQEVAEKYFPELKESDDEKTKRLLHTIANKMSQHLRDIFTEEEFQCFDAWSNAWLEKQGEQKHKIQPKFKIGDIIRFKGNETLKGEAETHKIVRYDNELYVFDDGTTDLFCEQDLYELVGQKSTWSEDDEKIFKSILEELKSHIGVTGDEYCKYFYWLKSIKDRYTWRPSGEQLEAFEHFVRSIGESGYASPYDNATKLLYSLLQDLKKLRGNKLWIRRN